MIKYWKLLPKSENEDLDKLLVDTFGTNGKISIVLHKHSCMNKEYPEIIVGEDYFIDKSGFLDAVKYVKVKITYKRAGIIFYKEKCVKGEQFFEDGSLIHYFAEPKSIDVDLNPVYFDVLSRSKMMKVNYVFSGYSTK